MRWMTPEKELRLRNGYELGKIFTWVLYFVGLFGVLIGGFAWFQGIGDGMTVMVLGVMLFWVSSLSSSILETDRDAIDNEKRVDNLEERLEELVESIAVQNYEKEPLNTEPLLREIGKILEKLKA